MDSINRNQEEENKKDLTGAEALEKLRDLVNGSKSCFFLTHAATGPSRGTRPMSVQEVDDEGNLWFLSAADSHKNQEIAGDPQVELFFQGSDHAGFLHIRGQAAISRDQQKIESLWSFVLKTWFTEGVTDPRITVIKVTPDDGYYWDTKHGTAIAGVKMLLGAALGKTMDDSIEGTIRP